MKHFSQGKRIASMISGVNPSNEGNEEPDNVDDEENYQTISNLRDQAQSPCAGDIEQA